MLINPEALHHLVTVSVRPRLSVCLPAYSSTCHNNGASTRCLAGIQYERISTDFNIS